MKIGIFGGTFDPPHDGHLNAVKASKETLELDRVIVVPAFASPFKRYNKITEPELRLRMCELAFTESYMTVSDFEVSRGEVTYTIDTVKHFKSLYPDDELRLIIGTDAFLSFDCWKSYKEIFKLCEIAVTARTALDMGYILDKFKFLLQYGDIDMVKINPINISSTQIRNNYNEHKEHIPEAVREFIKSQNLYEESNDLRYGDVQIYLR
jgi:nicotinate-nucleotide adenylyltransferase